jgi:hypothetical protein
MSLFQRTFGKVFSGRKGTRGNRRSPSRKQNRRLTLEHMESRVLLSANPISSAATHNLDNVAVPAIVANNLPGRIITTLAAPKLTATPCWVSQINLNWNLVSGATSYVVAEQTSSGWKEIATLPSGATSFSVKFLITKTTYTFRVGAQNSSEGTWSNVVSAACPGLPNPPNSGPGFGGPTNSVIAMNGVVKAPVAPTLTATPYSATQINLSWTAVSGATTYFLVEQTASGWKEIALLPSGTTSFSVKGLNANTTYHFKVAAQNSAGGTWSNVVSATTHVGGGPSRCDCRQ